MKTEGEVKDTISDTDLQIMVCNPGRNVLIRNPITYDPHLRLSGCDYNILRVL